MSQRFQTMLELEQQHLASSIRASAERLGALLSKDYFEFGASGKIWSRAGVIKSATREEGSTAYRIENYRVDRLGEHHVLATYELLTSDDNGVSRTLRSTVWRFEGGEWSMLFHQGTPVS